MNTSLKIGSAEMLEAREASKSGIAIGALLAVLGVLAMMAPLISGIAVTVLVGILMIAGGLMQTFFAFKAESFGKSMQEVEAATQKTWNEVQKASNDLVGELQDSIAEVNEKLKASLDMAPKDQD